MDNIARESILIQNFPPYKSSLENWTKLPQVIQIGYASSFIVAIEKSIRKRNGFPLINCELFKHCSEGARSVTISSCFKLRIKLFFPVIVKMRVFYGVCVCIKDLIPINLLRFLEKVLRRWQRWTREAELINQAR